MRFFKLPVLVLITLLIISCNKTEKHIAKKENEATSVKYATGFDIKHHDGYSSVTIKTPYQNAQEYYTYYLVKKNFDTSKLPSDSKKISIPISSIVVNSTTHIPMLELLEVENLLVGFPNTKYISSERTRNLIENNKVRELGNDGNFNTEVLLDLNPDAVVAFAMSAGNKSLLSIERANIPVIYNGDWLEASPLGRAEWIKLFGALFDQNDKANEIFNQIEIDYNQAKEIAKNSKNSPSILSGVMFKDVWNLPAGESFVAQFLKDANTNYLWKDTKGKGSLQLSFESVLDKGQNADIWIAPGHYENINQLNNASVHYKEFKAFSENELYTFANKKGTTGGVIYYELAPTRPDLVLKDIIKITHPDMLPNYTMSFFEKMK